MLKAGAPGAVTVRHTAANQSGKGNWSFLKPGYQMAVRS